MKNKVVFITGAGCIGLEIAKQFATDGAIVTISDLNSERLGKAEFALRNQNLKIFSIAVHVTNENEIILP